MLNKAAEPCDSQLESINNQLSVAHHHRGDRTLPCSGFHHKGQRECMTTKKFIMGPVAGVFTCHNTTRLPPMQQPQLRAVRLKDAAEFLRTEISFSALFYRNMRQSVSTHVGWLLPALLLAQFSEKIHQRRGWHQEYVGRCRGQHEQP